jgi:hypothetical protein
VSYGDVQYLSPQCGSIGRKVEDGSLLSLRQTDVTEEMCAKYVAIQIAASRDKSAERSVYRVTYAHGELAKVSFDSSIRESNHG